MPEQTHIAESTTPTPETIDCPLCLGQGRLSRTEVLERLGMRDFARVAQLSAEEAIRLLAAHGDQAEQARWARFEAELARRAAEAAAKHKDEMQSLQSERAGLVAAQRLAGEQKSAEIAQMRAELEAALSGERTKAGDLARQAKDYLQEIGSLRERNQQLETEMAKAARIGKREELDFAEEARSWPGIWLGDKLPRNGDYLLAFADAAGNALEPAVLVDNKAKPVCQADVRKLVRDAKERKLAVAALVTREECQLRHADRQQRWSQQDGVWLLRSTRAWLPRDLDVLRPLFERMRAEGPDFLQRNAALADEVRRTLTDVDEIESQLNKAGAAIGKAQELTTRHRARLAGLCDSAAAGRKAPAKGRGRNGRASAGNGDRTRTFGQRADMDPA